jgi:outer membrane protein OmpA-like peptidoglycan-associated protein
MKFLTKLAISALGATFLLSGQDPNPTQRNRVITVQPEPGMPTPIFRIEVVSRSTPAVNYLHRGGPTKIDFKGTLLMPAGRGSATVESERGVIHVFAEFKDFVPPSSFGPEYLTYVLWAISPDGRPVNMGELTLNNYGNGSKSDIKTTSEIQTFGMIVTAEPYYAVTQPSDVVVMENVVRKDTRGVIEIVNAKYELLPRGMYTSDGRAREFIPVRVDKKNPFELYEAQNAVMLARLAGAPQYAPDSFQKAVDALAWANRNQKEKPGQKPVITMAREAVLRAEDARVISIRAERQEVLAQERQASLDRETAAKAKADEEIRRRTIADAERARAEADRNRAEADRAAADRSRSQAQAAAEEAQRERQRAETAKLEADRARQEAIEQQQKLAAQADQAREAAARAQQDQRDAAARSQQEQTELRRQLLLQFNQILETRETARGLIVNLSDVLFDTGQYTLKPGAREKLAKVSGIILAHPGLKIEVEGHTDSIGGDEYNMRLSENRASAVRSYLVTQGLNSGIVTARGFGKTKPVANNATAAGRQQNRRVELVVSGDVMGTSVTTLGAVR